MGGLVGGLFDLFSGDPAEGQRKKFDALGNYETGLGESLSTAGAGVEEDILSGDPTRIAQVEAPEISAQRKQIEQQNLQNAEFGTRSGGTNASTQAADAAGRANIIDLTGNLIGSTAGSAVGQGAGLLGEASGNVGKSADLAEQRRQQQVGDVSGIASGVASIFTGGMAPEASAAADPYQTLYNAQHAAPVDVNTMPDLGDFTIS